MKKLLNFIILFYFINAVPSYGQDNFGVFSKTEFNCTGEEMNFFEWVFSTKIHLKEFLNIKKGDQIAEIGAGDGCNIGFLSTLYDNVTFIAQDIDAKSLKNRKFKRVIRQYDKHRATPQSNTFEIVIGTPNSSDLPDNKLDEILIIDSFHDFDKKDEMLDDIYKKLKPNGRFIILDGYTFPKDTQVCPDYGRHVLTTVDVEIERCAKHGFYLTKMRAPNFKAIHYGNALIFEKDKKRSDEFYAAKKSIDELVSHAFRFEQNKVATDSTVVKQITDSLQKNIYTITAVYSEFENWIREMGFKHLGKSEYQAAINIFRSNTELFPSSYQAYYWLGFAYEANKQIDLALKYYTMCLKLNPNAVACENRIKELNSKK